MTERDLSILRIVSRYALVALDVIHHLHFAELTKKAAERVVTRLLGEDLLRSQPLPHRTCCYTLTAAAARLLGLDEKRYGMPLGTHSVVKNYGILLFCFRGSAPRKRMTVAEFESRFGSLASRGLSHDRYFIDEQSRISLLVCDHGAEWRRLARKVRHEADRRLALAPWKPLFAGKLFSITLLCASPEKAKRLTAALAREAYPVVIEVVDELSSFFRSEAKRDEHH